MTDLEIRRRCCAVFFNAVGLPPGWVEIQCDDCPDDLPDSIPHAFLYDDVAAAWVSPAWRWFHISTDASMRTKECPDDWRDRLCMVPLLDAIDLGLVTQAEYDAAATRGVT